MVFRPNISDDLLKLMRHASGRGYVYPSGKKGFEGCRHLAEMGVFEEYDGYPGSYSLTKAGVTFLERVERIRDKQKEHA